MMVLLERFFDWRSALVVVKPDTLIRWHRKGFRLFWRWKSKPRGRPKFPAKLREFIREMAAANPNWGVARIADELLLKLGIRVSPRTVGKYLFNGSRPGRAPDPKQRWMTFVRNHAQAIVACDLLRGRDGHVSRPLCFRGPGSWDTQNRAPQCHGPSDSGMDSLEI
jgi:putative transposase